MTAACKKKVATAPPPPPPAPVAAAPTATLTANPTTIQQGQTTTLSWKTSDATTVTIEGIGEVPTSGVKTVTPNDSTTYTLTAKGPGGSQDASVRVTVNPAPAPVAAEAAPTDDELFAKNVKDVYFDYDDSKISGDNEAVVSGDAGFFSQHSNLKVIVEGHCDSRGSAEYNLALGESRADAVKKALVGQGINADRVKTISYGKERPFCTEESESCWAQNRRGHLVLQK